MISIIVPVYNVESFLPRCIDSVLCQSYTDFELILVDDGSPDSSPFICDEYAKKDIRVKVIHKQNGGLSSARNAGLQICKGDYIFFLDSDDWLYDETVISEFIEKAESEKCDFVYGLMNKADDEGVSLIPCNKRFHEDDLFFLSNPYLFSACNKLYSKNLLPYIKFVPGRVNEDVDVIPLVFNQARKIARINRGTYNYFSNQDSLTRKRFSEKRFDMFKSVKHVYDNFSGSEIQKSIFYENLFGFQLFSVYIAILLSEKGKERNKYLHKYLCLLKENKFELFWKYSRLCFLHNEHSLKRYKKLLALFYLYLISLFGVENE